MYNFEVSYQIEHMFETNSKQKLLSSEQKYPYTCLN